MTQKSHSTPLANSYWVLPGHLLAGEYPGSPYQEESRRKLGPFLDHGVDAFLDLTQEGVLMPYAEILDELAAARGTEIAYRRMSVRDMGIPTRRQIAKIIGQIESWIGDGRTVYVHCWGGIGRTGTVVGCFLAHRGRKGDDALAHLATLWQGVSEDKRRRYPVSPQTPAQLDFVRNWIPQTGNP